MATPQEYEATLEKYLEFTKSPIRDRLTRKQDFAELWRNPKKSTLKFVSAEVMVVGTTTIRAKDYKSDAWYEIGQFLIFIVRHRAHRAWSCEFWFYNIDNIINGRHHPHIITNEKIIAGFQVGRLCINDGHHGIYQAIRSGHISNAVTRLIHVLETYQPFPFLGIEAWPETIGGSNHD